MEPEAAIALPRYRDPGRDRQILEGALLDKSSADIARGVGCTPRTVRRVKQDNARWLDDRRRELQAIAVQKLQVHIADMMESLCATGMNPDARTQPQAARVAGELAGVIGKAGIHVGDVYNQTANVIVPAEYATEYDPALEAELRRQLGLSNC